VDQRLRELEREAATGDNNAKIRLAHLQQKIATPIIYRYGFGSTIGVPDSGIRYLCSSMGVAGYAVLPRNSLLCKIHAYTNIPPSNAYQVDLVVLGEEENLIASMTVPPGSSMTSMPFTSVAIIKGTKIGTKITRATGLGCSLFSDIQVLVDFEEL